MNKEQYTKKYIGSYNEYNITKEDALKDLKNHKGIEYKINSQFFRSKEFYKLDSKKINILYAGCSNTFGFGLTEEELWTTQLTKKFNFENVSTDNIAYCGASVHSIIRNIFAFLNNFGNPDYIFVLFPINSRNLFYWAQKYQKRESGHFINAMIPQINTQENVLNSFFEYSKKYSEEDSLMLYSTLLKSLEQYCKAASIKLIWSTWASQDYLFFNQLDFENLIDIQDAMVNNNLENVKNFPYWEIAYDKSHSGSKWHSKIADMYWDKIKND
jgi:hypothetical protein